MERAYRAGVHGQHQVARCDQVDLATDQLIRVVFRRFEGFKGEVEPILGPPGVRATEFLREPFLFRIGELYTGYDLVQRLVVLCTVEVDPQELALPELRDGDVGRVDPPVVSVGVEEPGGDGAQLTRASSAAATIATAATRYWRTCIPRSEVGSASSIKTG